MTVKVDVTYDANNRKWRMSSPHGANLVQESHLEVLINRAIRSNEKHFQLQLRHTPGGHSIRYNITEASDGKSLSLSAEHYAGKAFVAIGAISKAIKAVSFKSRIYIAAYAVAEDGSITPATAMIRPPPPPIIPCTLQPSLPGFP